MSSGTPKIFRNDLSFLRAIAIITVVLFHFDVAGFKHGYVGVDLFFLLSGFLMTDTLSKQKPFDVQHIVLFYWKRFRRIIPAFSVFILISWCIVWLLLGVKLYDFSKNALLSQAFLSNFYYYKSIEYFSPSSDLNFLTHTWSLAIEWQFYMLFPILLYLQERLLPKKSIANAIVLILLIISMLLLFLHYSKFNQSYSFYMPFCRFWEFLLGAFIYQQRDFITRRFPTKNLSTIAVCSIIGLVLVFPISNFMLQTEWSPWLIIIVLGLSSICILVHQEFSFYAYKPILTLANISYSWYLWHWFILVLSTYFVPNPSYLYQFAILLLTIGIAYLSYTFVEFHPFLKKKKSLVALFLSTLICCGLSSRERFVKWIIGKERGTIFHFFYAYPRYEMPFIKQFGKNHLLSKNHFSSFDIHSLKDFSEDQANYLLIGDCHAGMFYYTLKQLADEHQVNLIQATADEVFPTGNVQTLYPGSKSLMDFIFDEYLPKFHHQIDKVILVANYSGYTKSELKKFITRNESYFKKYNLPYVYIGQTEKYKIEFPVLVSMVNEYQLNYHDFNLFNKDKVDQFLLKELGSNKYIRLKSLNHLTANGMSHHYMYDAVHYSTIGTSYYKNLLLNSLFRE
ncbi:acyltransferase family protein [Sphingobacterium sp. HJSM2_6]|uniref:acyltransferase family protein n=1 Tax=Sphingobacterium sp. HJSM2_6 TaxID=3366264 RepID=UPI003BD9AB60